MITFYIFGYLSTKVLPHFCRSIKTKKRCMLFTYNVLYITKRREVRSERGFWNLTCLNAFTASIWINLPQYVFIFLHNWWLDWKSWCFSYMKLVKLYRLMIYTNIMLKDICLYKIYSVDITTLSNNSAWNTPPVSPLLFRNRNVQEWTNNQ